ncbi:MBL fold metallo-hydrolase [Marinobacter sp. AL4B]|uniref:MBL fold metallo-hydrolase n=1 Tax=Marinobacter sp. AL4B TaxID=2871173 RepID=UPI0039773ED4
MIEISHRGAANGVTGSCHELSLSTVGEPAKAGLFIDCGLFQGSESKDRSTAENLAIDFPIDHIRALVVTHVHIDHVGRIPYLLAAGFAGGIGTNIREIRPPPSVVRAIKGDQLSR